MNDPGARRGSPWPRRALIALGALLALLLVAAGVLVATFDADRYKSLAVDWMQSNHQRALSIDGPIELSVFPRLAVTVSKLRLSERGDTDDFLTVDQASLSVRVLPLLRKQLVVDRVRASGVRVVYVRDAKGVRNIDDLIAADGSVKGPSEAGPRDGAAPLAFDVSALKLTDVQIRVRDAMSPLDGSFTLASFESGRLAPGIESPVTLKANIQLSQPQALDVAIDGNLRLRLDPDKGTVSAAGMNVGLQGDTQALKAFAIGIEGDAAWDGGALRAGPLRVAVPKARLGPLTLAASALSVDALVFDPAAQRLELKALKATLAGTQGDAPFELAFDWPQLSADAKQLSGSAVGGSFKLGGPAGLSGKFQSAAPSGNFDALKLPGVKLSLKGMSGTRAVDAEMDADLTLAIDKHAATLDRLKARASLTDPGQPALALQLAGRASADPQQARWDLDGTVANSRFESTGQAALGGKVPRIKASAHFGALDLNALLGPPKAPAAAASGPAPPDTPVALEGLKALDGEFNVTAEQLAYRAYRVGAVQLDARLDAGTLRVPRLSAKAFGGQVDASGSAAATGNRIALKLVADGVDVDALVKTVTGKDLLAGTGRVSADVSSAGASIGALRNALDGTAALQVRDGAVKGFNLARALRQAKAALGGRQDASTKASATEKTDFSTLSISARIRDGVAVSDDLDLKSPFLRVGGAGNFDIGRGRIDYTARATVTADAAGQGGAELAALKGVTVPVRLSGPFEAIDWNIRWSEVAAQAVTATLKDKLSEALGKRLGGGASSAADGAASAPASPEKRLENQLKDTLKGLFKK